MSQQSPFQIESQKKSNRPIIALLLSLSSVLFCCISFAVNNPNGFDAYMENSPLWYVAEALMCVAALLPLAGAILGVLSLRAGESNRNLSITAIVIGISAFILATLFLAYVLFFVGVFLVMSPS
jgi:hypothetical protein